MTSGRSPRRAKSAAAAAAGEDDSAADPGEDAAQQAGRQIIVQFLHIRNKTALLRCVDHKELPILGDVLIAVGAVVMILREQVLHIGKG